MSEFACRPGCGACCIALSISTPIPGMPNGKASGETCVQLDENYRCKIFGLPGRPACCNKLKPNLAMCGENRDQALHYLFWLETATRPDET